MENQDFLKKNILEKNDTQNLDQVQGSINYTKEDISHYLQRINEKIEKKEEYINSTNNKINEIRTNLGLPPNEELPLSIQVAQESLKKLNLEKSLLEKDRKNPEHESESLKKFEADLRLALNDILLKSNFLLGVLYERQEKRLPPLQSTEEFQGMARHFKNIKNLIGKLDVNSLAEINSNLKKIGILFQMMTLKSFSGVTKENVENFEKISYGARSFVSTLEMAKSIGLKSSHKEIDAEVRDWQQNLGFAAEQISKLNTLALMLKSTSR
jgi:valyl-tRNA synthetase